MSFNRFRQTLQNAIPNGARHGNHDAYVSQVCRRQRPLDKGGPESAHGTGVPWVFGKSKGPSGCGQNNEGPGPVPRWQSGLPELSITSGRAHHCMQWLFCSKHEAEGEEVGQLEHWYPHPGACSPTGSLEESAPLLLVSRSGPLGNVQMRSNSNSTIWERKLNPMAEKLLSFILFASHCPQ